MASLYVVRGRDQGKHFQLANNVLRIGRDSTSDIQLFDSEASRSHAEIREDQASYELVDLSSSNGTRVNGKRVVKQSLSSGDRIEIGRTLLIFTGTQQPSSLEAAHGVDIVRQSRDNDASRIVSSMSQIVQPGKDESSSVERLSNPDRSLEVMYLTAIAVGRTHDMDELLNRILQLVFDWVEADRGCIMLRDNETNHLQPAARCDRRSPEDSDSDSDRISISHTILDYVLTRREGVRTSDASGDQRFDSAVSIVQGGVREALCVPLQGRYDVFGALYIDTYTPPGKLISDGPHQRFTDDHLRLITAIGHQAALAIEDTFYYSSLVQSERLAAMGQTIATLSHHVKNILQGIRGGSYLIEAGLERDDTDAVKRGWSIVDRNQERISNLVLDMLTFSKEREPERVEADLNATVHDVVELMQTRASEMQVQLTECLDADIPDALFDPDAIHRAVLNLVTNAIDASSTHANSMNDVGLESEEHSQAIDADPANFGQTAEGESYQARVVVRTRFHPVDGWMVDVDDNGAGVDEADREKIFSLFESGKGARGTGLGLPVSAKILREHGGDIHVLDVDEGTGARFRLVLPVRGTGIDRENVTNHS